MIPAAPGRWPGAAVRVRWWVMCGWFSNVRAGSVAAVLLAMCLPVAGGAGEVAPLSIEQLERQIGQLLTPAGMLAPAEGPGASNLSQRQELERIAGASNRLAQSEADRSTLVVRARQVELRAYHALAQDATAGDRAAEASYRLAQLRNAAEQARGADGPEAAATADFWLLVADLTDVHRVGGSVVDRQRAAIRRLGAFLEAHEAASVPAAIDSQVRAARVRLLDEVGRNAEAAEGLGVLAERLGADDPLVVGLADVADRAAMVGREVDVSLTTVDGERLALRSLRGRRVLVHVFADSVASSTAMFEAIAAAQGRLAEAEVAVVSISAGPTVRTAAEQAWPLAVAPVEVGGPLDRLQVRGLPLLMVLDAGGRVTAVGRSEAVFASLAEAAPQPR